jgi:hypothetical protein
MGSNPAWDMNVCLSLSLYVVLSCVSRGLRDELITHPKESYLMSSKIKAPKKGGQGPAWAIKARDDVIPISVQDDCTFKY